MQKTAYEMRISDWSSDVCSSDLLFLIQAIYLWFLAESVSPQPGAWQSLRPTLHVPIQARRALWLILPLNLVAWAVGGFYLSLAPSLVRAATGTKIGRASCRERVCPYG